MHVNIIPRIAKKLLRAPVIPDIYFGEIYLLNKGINDV